MINHLGFLVAEDAAEGTAAHRGERVCRRRRPYIFRVHDTGGEGGGEERARRAVEKGVERMY